MKLLCTLFIWHGHQNRFNWDQSAHSFPETTLSIIQHFNNPSNSNKTALHHHFIKYKEFNPVIQIINKWSEGHLGPSVHKLKTLIMSPSLNVSVKLHKTHIFHQTLFISPHPVDQSLSEAAPQRAQVVLDSPAAPVWGPNIQFVFKASDQPAVLQVFNPEAGRRHPLIHWRECFQHPSLFTLNRRVTSVSKVRLIWLWGRFVQVIWTEKKQNER